MAQPAEALAVGSLGVAGGGVLGGVLGVRGVRHPVAATNTAQHNAPHSELTSDFHARVTLDLTAS